MFWGSFAGREKGHSVFWEKDWQKMTAVSYSEKILPHVVQWLGRSMEYTGNRIGFMQDNTPCQKAALAFSLLRARGVEPIVWPAFPPDFNPIEAVWSLMEIFIQTNYPEFERGPQRSGEEIREILEEAWNVITPDQLCGLLVSMPARCQVIIDADGGPTRY
ncbi:hypothetical protein K3495_g2939 [Podosphaera aphanis]|nr:hypothetical protein K3495_g2939 [Podosphaera aphanis]